MTAPNPPNQRIHPTGNVPRKSRHFCLTLSALHLNTTRAVRGKGGLPKNALQPRRRINRRATKAKWAGAARG